MSFNNWLRDLSEALDALNEQLSLGNAYMAPCYFLDGVRAGEVYAHKSSDWPETITVHGISDKLGRQIVVSEENKDLAFRKLIGHYKQVGVMFYISTFVGVYEWQGWDQN